MSRPTVVLLVLLALLPKIARQRQRSAADQDRDRDRDKAHYSLETDKHNFDLDVPVDYPFFVAVIQPNDQLRINTRERHW